jgi:hypothetical protein
MKKTGHRDKRLKSASEWVKTYSGKHMVQGYARRYRVDKLCAVRELRMIGIEVSEEYENQLIQSIEVLQKQKLLRKENKDQELNSMSEFDSDENFAFIVGYTSGGFPYGITHEEMTEINENELE